MMLFINLFNSEGILSEQIIDSVAMSQVAYTHLCFKSFTYTTSQKIELGKHPNISEVEKADLFLKLNVDEKLSSCLSRNV